MAPSTADGAAIFQAGEEVRQRAGNEKIAQRLEARRMEYMHQLALPGVGGLQTLDRSDHHRKLAGERGNGDLHLRAGAEPRREQRRVAMIGMLLMITLIL